MHIKRQHYYCFLGVVAIILLSGCQNSISELPPAGPRVITKKLTEVKGNSLAPPAAEPTSTSLAPATLTPLPTADPTQIPRLTPSMESTEESSVSSLATAVPTATKAAVCQERNFDGNLLTIVTRDFGLAKDYIPDDLVEIGGHLPVTVTLGYDTWVREPVLEPLRQLITAMIEEELAPKVISGYRSYPAQAIAWQKWLEREPERAAIISAPPGFSEHQLGTTIDFGSYDLESLVGQEGIEFHTYFYQTPEGVWLAENAHRYGFTLSYPREAQDLTGFYYEPWHYRFVGIELATFLYDSKSFLTEFLLASSPQPCLP